jgi:hypothetical protein
MELDREWKMSESKNTAEVKKSLASLDSEIEKIKQTIDPDAPLDEMTRKKVRALKKGKMKAKILEKALEIQILRAKQAGGLA